jgi:hypothetical protein
MRASVDVVLAKPAPTRDELLSMACDVRAAVDEAEALIEAHPGGGLHVAVTLPRS